MILRRRTAHDLHGPDDSHLCPHADPIPFFPGLVRLLRNVDSGAF
jgi:hypothetical protein